MATPKQAHALVTYFGKKYKDRYAVDPKVNRYSARWGFDSILMDMSGKDAEALIDYYFETQSLTGHSLDWFFYNYEKLAEAKERTDADRKALKEIREATRKRTEEWRNKYSGDN